ncbi:MAG TPA: AAA family ATPase [Nitrososphaerales archaeon]|nr:AAA family ATPase [Nitrososphaerales archaeon]
MMLSERMRPKKISEMVGNEQARLQLVKWLKNWKVGTKPIFLSGPPGVGKSTAIHAVASEFGYTVLEYNASDVRTRENLRSVLSPTIMNSTLFGEEKMLVFLDEVDGLSGRSDYAGTEYILDFIEESRLPVAMAANVEDEPKLRKLQQKSIVLRFHPIDDQMMGLFLKEAARREHLKPNEQTLKEISSVARGDVRSALNLLQTLTGEDAFDMRTDQQFFSDAKALDSFFSAASPEQGAAVLRQFDATPYDKIRAVFDSIVTAKNLSLEEKSESLNILASADILLARMNRGQKWRLLRYFDKYLASAAVGKNLKRTDSGVPWNLKLAIWNDGRVVRSLQDRFVGVYHVGRSDFSSLYLPYFSFFFNKRPASLETFVSRFGLSESDARVLLKIAR